MSPQDRKKREDSIKQIVTDIDADSGDVLDELVHEAKAEEAAGINNEGVESQVRFLVDSWGLEATEKAIRETLGIEKIKDLHHVVCDSADQCIKCKRCGKKEPMPLPMEVRAWVAWSQEWAAPHRDCKEKPCQEESGTGGASPSTGPSSNLPPG